MIDDVVRVTVRCWVTAVTFTVMLVLHASTGELLRRARDRTA